MTDKPYKIHPNSLANLKPNGRPKGSKSRVTLTRQIYDGTLYELAKSRLPDVMKQIVDDAVNGDPKIRQKAQQLLMQAMQANAARDTERKDDKDNKLDIQIRRDGVLIQQGQNSLSIEGGVVSRQAGGDDGVVPYNPHTSDKISINALDPLGYTSSNQGVIDGVLCAPNTQIPYEQFVGPLQKHFWNYGDSVSFDPEYQKDKSLVDAVPWWDRSYDERYKADRQLDDMVTYDDLPLEPLPKEVEEPVRRAKMLFELLPDENDGVEESED